MYTATTPQHKNLNYCVSSLTIGIVPINNKSFNNETSKKNIFLFHNFMLSMVAIV